MAGHIEKLGKQRYRVRVFLGRDPETGKVRRHDKVIRGSLKDAESYLSATLREKDLGRHVQPSRLTLSQYLDQWLAAQNGTVRTRTYSDYEENLDRYIRGPLGKVRLDQLTPLSVQAVFSEMGTRLGSRTVRYAYTILSMALERAVTWRLIPENPAKGLSLPKRVRKKKVRSFDLAQATAFRRAAQSDRWHVWFELQLGTGVRPEESLGLQWPHVLWSSSSLRIEQALVRPRQRAVKDDLRKRRQGSPWLLEPVKTPESHRTVEVPPPVMELLKRHRKQQLEEIAAAGDAYENNNFVFATPLGAPLIESNLSGPRHFKRILRSIAGEKIRAAREAVGMDLKQMAELLGKGRWFVRQLEEGRPAPLTDDQVRLLSSELGIPLAALVADLELPSKFCVYDLRHSFATLSLLAGVDLLAVSRSLGHASIAITADTYSHFLPAMREQAVSKYTALIYGQPDAGSGVVTLASR